MSGRLELRRGVVVSEQPLLVEVEGERRAAWADRVLLGEMREGDEVVVNVAALDLQLGSGGFDVVHVNLTRGVGGGARGVDSGTRAGGGATPGGGVVRQGQGQTVAPGEPEPHVMKLNYTSLQHPVHPAEPAKPESVRFMGAMPTKSASISAPVLVLPLHGHLAPAAWAAARARPGVRVGYVQTGGGALPGSLSRDVAQLRERGLLCGHVTAAPAYGGEHEALSTVGALDAALGELGWDAVLLGPGPGIIGSDTALGHGGTAAIDSAHAALSLRLPTLLSPRLSSADPRRRHRGLSHHTRTVLELLLASVDVAVPEGSALPAANEALQALEAASTPEAPATSEAGAPNDRFRHTPRHTLRRAPVDLEAYAASELPTTTMGRELADDPLFFAAPLAAGHLLAS